jgi:molybdopterin/thiamine biosynthesis adenylyltransferase
MAHVIVVGAGVIGSHALPHLARSPRVSHLTVIDRDRYDAGNLRTQDIDERHVGKAKAAVQARRLRRINGRIEVTGLRAAVEDVPLGALRADVIVACLDSRAARMAVNQAAWRLGVPWIDAGVDAGGLLARVRVFVPGADAPCLECAWDQAHYDAVEQRYPCAANTVSAPSGAPSSLGALAAALQVIECDKLLAGQSDVALIGRDVLLDARHHRHAVTEYRRNPACRMPDHAGWRISPLGERPVGTTLADVLTLGSTLRGAGNGLSLGVAGQRTATALRCTACGAARQTFQLERHARATAPCCPQCGGAVTPGGFDLYDLAPTTSVPVDVRDLALADLGVRPHDVLTRRTSELDAHFELDPPAHGAGFSG